MYMHISGVSSSSKDTSHTGRGPHPYNLIHLIQSSFRNPVSKYNYIEGSTFNTILEVSDMIKSTMYDGPLYVPPFQIQKYGC